MEAPLLTLPNDKDRDGATSYNYGTSLRDDETTLVHRRSDEWDQEPQDDGFVNVEGLDPTAEALKRCENWVLRPYRFVLIFLGWISYSDSENRTKKLTFSLVRIAVVIMWLLGLVTVSITQILTCFRRDLGKPDFKENVTVDDRTHFGISCQNNIITLHVVTDSLIIVTYLFGIHLFSTRETEYLSNLADKTFIKCSTANMHKQSKLLIYTLGAYLTAGIVFIVLSMIIRAITAQALGLYSSDTTVIWSNSTPNITDVLNNRSAGLLIEGPAKTLLVIISLAGFVTFDVVYVAAVVNYAAQSEMNIKLLYAIQAMVEQKLYPDIDSSIKDIYESQRYLKVLNGKTATATALILFNLGAATVNSINNLGHSVADYTAVVSGVNTLLWLSIVSFPFVQAARVTAACESVKNTAALIRSRPMQYIQTPQLELDSYTTFTNSITLRSEMFGIPVYPWMVYFVTVAFVFTMLLLFQTKTLNYLPFF